MAAMRPLSQAHPRTPWERACQMNSAALHTDLSVQRIQGGRHQRTYSIQQGQEPAPKMAKWSATSPKQEEKKEERKEEHRREKERKEEKRREEEKEEGKMVP